eukprot:TRINITY_DN8524_c0_g1_i2.p1 TRINITY_DN8524_c0_g1~~TRINITY_DN8524_c0_g1_i2.p1  ORF type:complete len:408 (+),score=84.32 TRINITY_DN8524_c0_g1_i2:164-1225(+)
MSDKSMSSLSQIPVFEEPASPPATGVSDRFRISVLQEIATEDSETSPGNSLVKPVELKESHAAISSTSHEGMENDAPPLLPTIKLDITNPTSIILLLLLSFAVLTSIFSIWIASIVTESANLPFFVSVQCHHAVVAGLLSFLFWNMTVFAFLQYRIIMIYFLEREFPQLSSEAPDYSTMTLINKFITFVVLHFDTIVGSALVVLTWVGVALGIKILLSIDISMSPTDDGSLSFCSYIAPRSSAFTGYAMILICLDMGFPLLFALSVTDEIDKRIQKFLRLTLRAALLICTVNLGSMYAATFPGTLGEALGITVPLQLSITSTTLVLSTSNAWKWRFLKYCCCLSSLERFVDRE